jgi:DNA helicase II / ATP-dependent DNA helicase PcrA
LEGPGLYLLNQNILDSLISNDPTIKMQKQSKLFSAKIRGILSRTNPITQQEIKNRSILTIHGSKGLEADAVFLHTSITARIHSALLKPGAEMEAEARVWYVGVTRAKEILYLIKDVGMNYPLPQVISC